MCTVLKKVPEKIIMGNFVTRRSDIINLKPNSILSCFIYHGRVRII